MPELPEVEIVRRGLEPVLSGRVIERVEQRRKDLRFPFPEQFAERLAGRRVTSLTRRAKYLLMRLDGGDVLVMHLGMSGRFSVASGSDPLHQLPRSIGGVAGKGSDPIPGLLGEHAHNTGGDPKHDHVVFRVSGGCSVTYNDPRRFGFMLLIRETEFDVHPLFANLGVEPLGNSLTAGYLAERARGRKSDLKAFLMDQRIVAGLGNIYVSEALHRAALSPLRAAGSLAKKSGTPTFRAEKLVPEIRNVLEAALDAGGSTLKDYRKADGSMGGFQHRFSVYGRDGEACVRPGCKGIVRRTIQAGRATFHCPVCQR